MAVKWKYTAEEILGVEMKRVKAEGDTYRKLLGEWVAAVNDPDHLCDCGYDGDCLYHRTRAAIEKGTNHETE